jgi:hypothetical protein
LRVALTSSINNQAQVHVVVYAHLYQIPV